MINIRQAKYQDFTAIQEILANSNSLDKHTPYTYWSALYNCPDLFYIAEQDSTICGFVFGIADSDGFHNYFIWQIGVLPKFRSLGVASKLLEKFVNSSKSLGAGCISFTITEDNIASHNLFTKFAKRNNLTMNKIGETTTMSDAMKNEIIYRFQLS